MSSYTVKVEESRAAADRKPSAGPVYRSIYAKDGLMECLLFLNHLGIFSVNQIEKSTAGRRQVVDKKVYETTVKIDSAIRSRGVNPGDRCGIYGVNSPEWIMAMEACNSQAISYVPLYDSLGVMDKIEAAGLLKSLLFQDAYNYKLRNMDKVIRQDEAAPRFDRLVFDKIILAFGGRVHLMLSGAAPLPKHVEEFLRVMCCCSLSQGYGLTESCGGCFTSVANVYPMVGTVGIPMTTIEARLESVPEMGYDALASVPREQICLGEKTLFSGYHKRDLTKSILVDGWFHTGDIGEWQPDGAMKIIDRKRTYSSCPKGSIYSRPPLVLYFFQVLILIRKKLPQLQGFEMLRAVHLEPNPFDIERDLVTPTFKLKRRQLLNYYKDIIDQLYKEAKAKTADRLVSFS